MDFLIDKNIKTLKDVKNNKSFSDFLNTKSIEELENLSEEDLKSIISLIFYGKKGSDKTIYNNRKDNPLGLFGLYEKDFEKIYLDFKIEFEKRLKGEIKKNYFSDTNLEDDIDEIHDFTIKYSDYENHIFRSRKFTDSNWRHSYFSGSIYFRESKS